MSAGSISSVLFSVSFSKSKYAKALPTGLHFIFSIVEDAFYHLYSVGADRNCLLYIMDHFIRTFQAAPKQVC